LTTTELHISQEIEMKFTNIIVWTLISLGFSMSVSADTIIADNREWMPLLGTGGKSYYDMSHFCSTTTGVCTSGTINGGESLVGWTWASNEDVASLFDYYIGSETITFSFTSANIPYYKEKTDGDSLFGPKYSADFGAFEFRPTGMTRDLITAFGVTHITRAYILDLAPGGDDTAQIRQSPTSGMTFADSHVGQFLYRDIATVPVPAAAWLFGSGLISLIGVARRKKA
jgi:hypothetical protein